MSSPLFRWKFDSPKRPAQRTESEETFFEEKEKNGLEEPDFQSEAVDMIECRQFPTHRGSYDPDSLANEALSQDVLTPSVPVPRNSIPSGDSTPSNLDFPVQNIENTGFFLQKWTNESQTQASRYRKRSTASSTETFFEGEIEFCAVQTNAKNCSPSLLRCAVQNITGSTQGDFRTTQEILTGLDDSQFNAYPADRNSQAPSTDATFFEEKKVEVYVKNKGQLSSTSHCNAPEDLEMSVEILTGLEDSQFNTYPADRNSQAPSTDATFFEEKKVEVYVKNKGQLSSTSHCNSPEDLEMSIEILTGLGDSQFNTHPANSQAFSTDATFFDRTGNRDKVYAGGCQSCQERDGPNVTKNGAELPKASTSVFGRVLNQNQTTDPSETSCIIPETGACLDHELNQDIIELIEDMPADPIFDLTDLNNIIEMLVISSDPSNLVGLSPTFVETVEFFNKLNLSSGSSGLRSSLPKDIFRTARANKRERALSPSDVGEKKKRRTNELESAQQVRPIGKPSLTRIKKAKKSREPRTPCHRMSLRTRENRSSKKAKCSTRVCSREETSDRKSSTLDPGYVGPKSRKEGTHKGELSYQTAKCTPKSFSPESAGKKKSSQGSKNAYFDPDHIGAIARKENTPIRAGKRFGMQTPLSKVSAKGQEKTPEPLLNASFERSPFIPRGKRGRPAKIQCTPKTRILDRSTPAISGKRCSTSTGKYSREGTSPRVGKLNVRTNGKLFRRELSDEPRNVVLAFWAQLSRDEICLRNIRRKLLDVIFDEATISKEEAKGLEREIREKQLRIRMWNQPGVDGKKDWPQVKEFEALCDTLLHQIGTILADLSSGESRVLPVPKTKNAVSQRTGSDAMSVSPPRRKSQLKTISDKGLPKKDKSESEKSNMRGIASNRRPTKQTTPSKHAKQAATSGTKCLGSSRSGERKHLPSSGINVITPPNIQPLGPSPGEKLQNIPGRSFQTKGKVILKKSNLDGAVANLRGRRKNTPAKHATNNRDRKRSELSRVVLKEACRVESPSCPPIKLTSSLSLDLREDTLAEHNLSGRRSNERSCRLESIAGHSPSNVCGFAFACGASSTKVAVDIGTNTDFFEPHNKSEKKILVDRSTNTDPEDFNREDHRKVLVDFGTNTDFICSAGLTPNLQVRRKVLSSVNKQDIGKLDLKNITRVWLPRAEDFLSCSYDQLSPDFFAKPNAELPQELLDDLTW